MYVLGLWDGHDSGAALLRDNQIIYAANEERFTKRKLEVKFPYNSIRAALAYAKISPEDVEIVAFSTLDFTKTLTRMFPEQKERYYQFRRRKMLRPNFESLRHFGKYEMTSIGVLPFCNTISKSIIASELGKMGFRHYKLYSVDHHTAHAATAAFPSGFKRGLIITLDGVGDGLSGSISTLKNGILKGEKSIPARNSLGIFYEQVTNIVGMRELEDEGKVMAMADYSFPFPFEQNRLRDFFKVSGTEIIAKHGPITQYEMLSRIAWSMPREQFAYMAQQLAEHVIKGFVNNAIEEFGISDVALSGGVFSNVKANMKVKDLKGLRSWFVFPHMGDGGLAMGAAMYANYIANGISYYAFENAYFGDSFSEDQIKSALKGQRGISYERVSSPGKYAGELINKNNYVFWFQGRAEFGPRALGNRSILANAGDEQVKEKLNIHVKQREWYQPFAPAMLKEDAPRLLEGVKGDSRFMTMTYKVRHDKKEIMKSVIHVDLTARPQILENKNVEYESVMKQVKKATGYGVVLNTSFNIHGQPIVTTPQEAIETMKTTKTRYMFLGNYLVERKG
ncbi:MAG TPA: carbamoyltransferase C-terminal domain-containing protein [Candidatus Aquilonibacter sp.]|nr:carbamoyltransferase C-terminal domain-containing protein [Candidatus Aquilonibacter sp.]